MSELACKHPDIRKFSGLRCCLACGETIFEASATVSTAENVDVAGRYKYTKLNYELGLEIRLVVLLPGDHADPICCEIIHVNLDDEPDYEAVSYTWATESGDASLSKTVRCVNGGLVAVTANCEAALRQLRRIALRRRVWIDAMCIDQTNIDERNHQVNQMDRVYTLASNVRICLQNEVGLSIGTDYSALFQKYERIQAHDSPTSLQFPVSSAVHPRIPATLSEDRFLPALQLFSSKYFKRVWVLQEVILARHAYMVINDQEFLLTSQAVEALLSICSRIGRQPPSVLGWRATQTTTSSLISCLYASMHCEMTDPRDGVYAVLSLMETQCRSLIPVSYASSVTSVYASAIAAYISTQQDLRILSYVGVGSRSQQRLMASPDTATGWRTAICLDKKSLQEFILDSFKRQRSGGRERPTRMPFTMQFGKHTVGPWQSTVNTKIVSSNDYQQGITPGGSCSCIVEQPRTDHQDYLPRIRVRAHYIDSVDQTVFNFGHGRSAGNIGERILFNPSCLKDAGLSWLLALLGGSREASSSLPDGPRYEPERWFPPDRYLDEWLLMVADANLNIPETNLADIWTFCNQVYRLHCHFFSCHFTVGYAQLGIQIGDEIFAVDGVKSPLILRQTGVNEYRIVTVCWLLAALELDCWNPGTKKGRWGEHVERPTVTQTRMIEIH